MGAGKSRARGDGKYDDDYKEDDSEDALKQMELHLTRLIAYAESADTGLQREVAERLANEAVKPERQVQIVALGGLRLLVPLTKSRDPEVRRLAAHALANLSVDAQNQIRLADEGGIPVLVDLLECDGAHVQLRAIVHQQHGREL